MHQAIYTGRTLDVGVTTETLGPGAKRTGQARVAGQVDAEKFLDQARAAPRV
jgi:hypothetical protein